jgi:DNA-binding HxlR family transcriptional regulator
VRSYRQYCAVAKGLDVVGDRWTLLIVRELLTRGPSRYTDLRNGLPGIATNLLADRLRELERAGILESEVAPPPIATTLFRLTRRGHELEPVLHAIGRWGGQLLAQPAEGDTFQTHWLALPLRLHLRDQNPEGPPITIQLRTGDEPMLIETADGAVTTRTGTAADPDAVLEGPPETVVALLTGQVGLTDARARGLTYQGDPEVFRRLQPRSSLASFPRTAK